MRAIDGELVYIMIGALLLVMFFFQIITLSYLSLPKIKKEIQSRRRNKKILHPRERIAVILEISEALLELQSLEKGALIIIESNDTTDFEVIDGELLDSRISKSLLVNIFEGSKTPLHDGAVIIKKDRITYAGGFITTLAAIKTTKKYGTRHRSAISITRKVDCLALVVSEETGEISLILNGEYKVIDSKNLFEEISNIMIGQNKYID